MKLTLKVQQDLKRFLAVSAVSLALIVGQAGVANAAPVDSDRDGLSNAQEKITQTSLHKPDSNGDWVKDADEDRDHDGVDNSDEFAMGLRANDVNPDDDRLLDGDEDEDGNSVEDGDEDDADEDDEDD